MSRYRYFEDWELGCRCDKCRDNPSSDYMDPEFMRLVVQLREELGFAFPVTSAYRCPEHPAEAKKSSPGAHTSGKAIDIQLSGARAYRLLKAALEHGMVGVGLNQKGNHKTRFVHLDMDVSQPNRPWVWTY